MSELGLLASVLVSAAAGCAAGFVTGLVPGLHVNNLAASTVAGAGTVLSVFASLGDAFGSDMCGLMASCFLVSALISHCFSEAVPNTYVGIPAGDVITVLPAHRLARAGMGWTAVRSSMDGSLAGVLLGLATLVPVSFVLGPSVGLYGSLKAVMGPLILTLSAALVLSDCFSVRASLHPFLSRVCRASKVLSIFLASGVLGFVVLDTNYFACDLPGCQDPFVPRSSLLLPLFAGLFGLPTILLSIGQTPARDLGLPLACKLRPAARVGRLALSVAGGVLVGWIPGLTSGSSATLCSSLMRRPSEDATSADDSASFIWLCSAISTAGAVMSVGALFTILRSRSGVMDAVAAFVSPESAGENVAGLLVPAALLLSMVLATLLSYFAMAAARGRLKSIGRSLCSKRLSLCALAFICVLVAALTGLRGAFLLATACALGLLPPLVGVRRIHLMGCLLVPISVMFML